MSAVAAACESKAPVQIYKVDPCEDIRWSRFLSGRSDASVFHTEGWLRALQLTYGYAPIVYTTSGPDVEIINGVVFCEIRNSLSPKRLVSVPFADHTAILVNDPVAFEEILGGLRECTDERVYKYVEIRACDNIRLPNMGFRSSAIFYWHKLSLRDDIDRIYGNFHKNCVQRKIRRAERERLGYAEGASEELIQVFYNLQTLTHKRHGVPPQPIAWFRNLVKTLGPMIKIRVASIGNIPIASIITIACRRSMLYKYGGSDANYHRLGGMAFLLWRAIVDAKRSGLEELDLGRSYCDNVGLINYKERWGAERTKLLYWSYPEKSRPNLNGGYFRAARRVFTRLPSPVLKVLGELLYKRMG